MSGRLRQGPLGPCPKMALSGSWREGPGERALKAVASRGLRPGGRGGACCTSGSGLGLPAGSRPHSLLGSVGWRLCSFWCGHSGPRDPWRRLPCAPGENRLAENQRSERLSRWERGYRCTLKIPGGFCRVLVFGSWGLRHLSHFVCLPSS